MMRSELNDSTTGTIIIWESFNLHGKGPSIYHKISSKRDFTTHFRWVWKFGSKMIENLNVYTNG